MGGGGGSAGPSTILSGQPPKYPGGHSSWYSWQTLKSQPVALKPGHTYWPGHHWSAWAVPAASSKPASAQKPDSSTVVANPTITRFINLGLFSAAAARVLGIRVNRDVRFTLVPLVASGRGRPCSKWTPPALLPIPTSRAIHGVLGRYPVSGWPGRDRQACARRRVGCARRRRNCIPRAKVRERRCGIQFRRSAPEIAKWLAHKDRRRSHRGDHHLRAYPGRPSPPTAPERRTCTRGTPDGLGRWTGQDARVGLGCRHGCRA
jgi:hypothetical protein